MADVRGTGAGAGAGAGTGSAFAWVREQPPVIDTSPPELGHVSRRRLEGFVFGAAESVLRAAGLLDVVEAVVGRPEELIGAAREWAAAAASVRGTAGRLRGAAVEVAGSWDGDAAVGFGRTMGDLVHAVDALAKAMAGTADVLTRAARRAAVAEDLAVAVVADAVEWALAELAATLVADVLTLGLASVAGALAESATLAVFVARATRISAEAGEAMELLAVELAVMKEEQEAIRAATGLAKVKALRAAHDQVEELELLGGAANVVERVAGATIGLSSGLPVNGGGARKLREVLLRSVLQEVGTDQGQEPSQNHG